LSGSRGRPEVSASITVRYDCEETARAVLAAISPDNLQAPPDMALKANMRGGTLDIAVTCSRGLGSMISTLDDLLSCIQAAERAIRGIS